MEKVRENISKKSSKSIKQDLGIHNILDKNNELEKHCLELLQNVEKTCLKVRNKREDYGYTDSNNFSKIIKDLIKKGLSGDDDFFEIFEILPITREKFSGDFTLKSTKLLKKDKSEYIKSIIPDIIKRLGKIKYMGISLFEGIESKGIYINLTINKKIVLNGLNTILKLGDRFGESSVGKGKDIVIDYSSPNAAKHLHAGHIRSTIIGHVLGNLYEKSGYTVHRINYLNDWGGIGFLIEGLERWGFELSKNFSKNDLLYKIYSIFRAGEKLTISQEEYLNSDKKEREEIIRYFGSEDNYLDFKKCFNNYKNASETRFKNLENGVVEDVETWKKIIKWSLEDFEKFYEILKIKQDYLTGESLYSALGKKLIRDSIKEKDVVFFDIDEARKELEKLDKALLRKEITEAQREKLAKEIIDDTGSYVVILDNFERYVVLKGNENTIYSTRDLAAIKHRKYVFNPEQIIYEVGQEQKEHFDKLFKSSEQIGFGKGINKKHIFHGFYVNDKTKKRLSSRDGASNILKLLNDNIAYYYEKYKNNTEFSEEEKINVAHTLGVGSIIFNDLRKDKKAPVELSNDINKMVRQFEASGGAYIIYSSCRAKRIINSSPVKIPNINKINADILTEQEIDLITKILEYPDVLNKAMQEDDPVKITDYLLKLAAMYNSYYNSHDILKTKNYHRLIIIKCVSQVLDNGLNTLHIGTLDSI